MQWPDRLAQWKTVRFVKIFVRGDRVSIPAKVTSFQTRLIRNKFLTEISDIWTGSSNQRNLDSKIAVANNLRWAKKETYPEQIGPMTSLLSMTS